MWRTILAGVVVGLSCVGLCACGNNCSAPQGAADESGGGVGRPAPSAESVQVDKGDKKAQGKRIPLDSIHSTSSQKGLKQVDPGKKDDYAIVFSELVRGVGGGASNVFLVRADDIGGAVMATWEAYFHRPSVDVPVFSHGQRDSSKFWLVVFLGTHGSDSPAWMVNFVEVEGKTVRLNYTFYGARSQDRFKYFVWVPLGTLPAGPYTLELFDQEQKQLTLVRRVTVGEK